MTVFQQYLQNVVLDLWENGILSRSLAMIHIIEFQKCGLPHAHLVLTLSSNVLSKTIGFGVLLTLTLSFLPKYQVANNFLSCMRQF